MQVLSTPMIAQSLQRPHALAAKHAENEVSNENNLSKMSGRHSPSAKPAGK